MYTGWCSLPVQTHRQPTASLQNELADDEAEDQHSNQVDYWRLVGEGWCIDIQR